MCGNGAGSHAVKSGEFKDLRFTRHGRPTDYLRPDGFALMRNITGARCGLKQYEERVMRKTLLALAAAAFIAGLPGLSKADSGEKMIEVMDNFHLFQDVLLSSQVAGWHAMGIC